MVTWSTWAAGTAGSLVQPSEYFASGICPSNDAANFAACCFIASLAPDLPGEMLFHVTIGTELPYTITIKEARDMVFGGFLDVLHLLDTMEALRQLRAAAEV